MELERSYRRPAQGEEPYTRHHVYRHRGGDFETCPGKLQRCNGGNPQILLYMLS